MLNPATHENKASKGRIRILEVEGTQKSGDSDLKHECRPPQKHKLKFFMELNNRYVIIHAHFAYFYIYKWPLPSSSNHLKRLFKI